MPLLIRQFDGERESDFARSESLTYMAGMAWQRASKSISGNWTYARLSKKGEERMNNLHAPPLMIASERFSTNFGIPRHGTAGDYRIVRNITLRTRSPLNVIYVDFFCARKTGLLL